MGILLPSLGRVRLPLSWTVAGFNRGVFLTGVPLGGHRNQRGVNHLAAPALHPLLGQIGVKLHEEFLKHPPLHQGLPEESDGVRIGNALTEIEVEEPHEGEPVADVILRSVIRQVVESL